MRKEDWKREVSKGRGRRKKGSKWKGKDTCQKKRKNDKLERRLENWDYIKREAKIIHETSENGINKKERKKERRKKKRKRKKERKKDQKAKKKERKNRNESKRE